MKTVKWDIWYKWMLLTSLIAGGIVPITFCSYMTSNASRFINVEGGLVFLIIGGISGLLIGLLQWAVIPRKLSFTPSNSWLWWWLLGSFIIWSISSYGGTVASSVVGMSFYSEASVLLVAGMIAISWPIVVLGIGLAIQGVVIALFLQYVTLDNSP
ncbi:MAG: hypothetical protein GY796_20375 [Chloroflexi bacterium]|nr:hypothetical protein [Chloroflexota bacterium]